METAAPGEPGFRVIKYEIQVERMPDWQYDVRISPDKSVIAAVRPVRPRENTDPNRVSDEAPKQVLALCISSLKSSSINDWKISSCWLEPPVSVQIEKKAEFRAVRGKAVPIKMDKYWSD